MLCWTSVTEGVPPQPTVALLRQERTCLIFNPPAEMDPSGSNFSFTAGNTSARRARHRRRPARSCATPNLSEVGCSHHSVRVRQMCRTCPALPAGISGCRSMGMEEL